MTTRLHTQDATHQMDGLTSVQRSIRLILADRLTEVQNRRMSLLFGLDGAPAMGVRQAARAEGVGHPRVLKTLDGAVARLLNDWRLWGYWLLQGVGGTDSLHSEETDAATLHDLTMGDVAEADVLHPEDTEGMRASVTLRPSGEYWSGDADGRTDEGQTSEHVPATTGEQEAYADGWLARGDGERENPYENDGLRAAWQRGWDEADLSVS